MESLPGVLRPERRGQQIGVPARHSGPFFSGLNRTSKRRPLPAAHACTRYHFHQLVGGPSPMTIFLDVPLFFRDPQRFAEPHQLLALRGRETRTPVSPVRGKVRLTHSRNAVSVRSRSRAAAPTVLPSSSTRRTALALNSSVNWRRARRFGVSAIGLDIVFPLGKMSTKPDQVHAILKGKKVTATTTADAGDNKVAGTLTGLAARGRRVVGRYNHADCRH